jgi:phage terminase small subunit
MVKRVQLKKSQKPLNRLDDKQRTFVREYLSNGRSASRAARAAGYVGKNANVMSVTGYEVARLPAVRALIDEETQKSLERLQITGDDVAKYWWSLATSDARELSPIARAACRHCYGVDFQYQFTLAEFRLARGAHISKQMKLPPKQRKPFDELGGIGYDKTKQPNPDCTECNGKGIWISRPINLDALSPGAALLFDGVKQDRHGNIEIKLRDRSRAMEMFGYITGLGPKPGSTINFAQLNEINVSQLSDEQLDALLARLAMSMSPEQRPAQTALDDLTDVTPGDNEL